MKRPNSVEEADALIEQQESIIGQIDVQIRERLRLVLSGDLTREDFDGWLVRAMDRRNYAASDLAELRFYRHNLKGGSEAIRKELACLRAKCTALQDEVGTSEVRRALKEKLARATAAIHELNQRLATLQKLASKIPTGGDLNDYTLIPRATLNALTSERAQRRWLALLRGENAVLHPDRQAAFLRYCAEEVPSDFRREQESKDFTP